MAETMPQDELRYWIGEWADAIHYHDSWLKSKILRRLQVKVPNKPSLIQIHTRRAWLEDFGPALGAKVPLALTAEVDRGDWPEADYVVPSAIDITEPCYCPPNRQRQPHPTVSHAPSNWAARGWEGDSFKAVNPILTELRDGGDIYYQLIVKRPHREVLALKRHSDIGVDEILTGTYGFSSLEYLSLGVPCFADIGPSTNDAIKELTGATELPWLAGGAGVLRKNLGELVRSKMWQVYGERSRLWMETYWKPETLVNHYLEMYRSL
ncbi:MAG: hypothetical protein MUP21_06055 [Dehalococcoidia bacterium]|nr:hypothetical protein [Dehalococcoidia bacterium]